jgi:hypothetical protein
MSTITAAAPSRLPSTSSGNADRLPPGGHDWLAYRGRSGPLVTIGPDGFAIAARRWRCYPCMVLPDGEDPLSFHWPIAGYAVLVHEAGAYDTERLERLARALLRDGATLVLPLRQALLDEIPPRSWPLYRSLADVDAEAAHG